MLIVVDDIFFVNKTSSTIMKFFVVFVVVESLTSTRDKTIT